MVEIVGRKTGVLLLTAVLTLSIILITGQGRVTAVSPEDGPPEGWVVECIECIHYFTEMSGNSAVLDSGGMVHTVYGGDGLYYAVQQTDDTFQIEVIDDNPYRGQNATMVFDSQQRPHVLYYAADLQRLNYAHFDGAQWLIETIPTPDLTSLPYPWLVIDSSDNLHLVYNENGAEVVYGRYDQNSWSFTAVEAAGAVGIGRPSIALDSTETPHITYASGQKYAYFDGLDWQITTFTDPFTYGENAAIAIDQNDRPHIAFQADIDEDIYYDLLYRFIDENSNWQWELIEEATIGSYGFHLYAGAGISLLFDSANQLTISYTGNYRGPTTYPAFNHFDLRMAVRDSNGWTLLPRFNTSFTVYDTNYNTMIHGPDDSLRIVLKDGPDMKLIKLPANGNFDYYFIDRGGSTGSHGDLAVDNEGRIHSSHHEAELDHLRYGLKENGVWTVESLAYNTGFVSSDWTSIALTSGGLPFVMFDVYDRPYDHLKYKYFDGQQWITEYHLLPWNDGDRYDLAMDQNNDLHTIFFLPYNGEILNYIVRYSEDSWSSVIQLDKDLVDGKSEMILDTADFPHIVYPKEDGLGYAEQTPTGWLTGTIAGGEVGDTTLALDEAGNPHIAWYDAAVQDLKYAYHDGNSWHFAAIDTEGDVGQYPDIEVDNLGRVYIAYYDATNQDLKYAYHDGSGWATTTLLTEGDVGRYASLVLPFAGYPAISYYDGLSRDLMMVYRPFLPTDFSHSPVFLKN